MSGRKNREGLEDGDVAANVKDLMREGQRSVNEAKTAGKGLAAHGGKKGIDKRGVAKMSLDLSLGHQEIVRRLADRFEVTQYSIAEYALEMLLEAIEKGVVDPMEHREIISSTKAHFKLVKPPNVDFF